MGEGGRPRSSIAALRKYSPKRFFSYINAAIVGEGGEPRASIAGLRKGSPLEASFPYTDAAHMGQGDWPRASIAGHAYRPYSLTQL